MSRSHLTPQILKGSIIAIDAPPARSVRILFQYDPEGVRRSSQPQVLVAEQGLPPDWQNSVSLAVLTEQPRPGSRPESIGQQVAQAILGNMNAASQPVQSSRTDAAGMSAQKRRI